MSAAPPSRQESLPQKVMAELKRKWWLWGCIAFTVLLLGSLFVFRSSLYDTATHGLPFLAGLPSCVIFAFSMSHKGAGIESKMQRMSSLGCRASVTPAWC